MFIVHGSTSADAGRVLKAKLFGIIRTPPLSGAINNDDRHLYENNIFTFGIDANKAGSNPSGMGTIHCVDLLILVIQPEEAGGTRCKCSA